MQFAYEPVKANPLFQEIYTIRAAYGESAPEDAVRLRSIEKFKGTNRIYFPGNIVYMTAIDKVDMAMRSVLSSPHVTDTSRGMIDFAAYSKFAADPAVGGKIYNSFLDLYIKADAKGVTRPFSLSQAFNVLGDAASLAKIKLASDVLTTLEAAGLYNKLLAAIPNLKIQLRTSISLFVGNEEGAILKAALKEDGKSIAISMAGESERAKLFNSLSEADRVRVAAASAGFAIMGLDGLVKANQFGVLSTEFIKWAGASAGAIAAFMIADRTIFAYISKTLGGNVALFGLGAAMGFGSLVTISKEIENARDENGQLIFDKNSVLGFAAGKLLTGLNEAAPLVGNFAYQLAERVLTGKAKQSLEVLFHPDFSHVASVSGSAGLMAPSSDTVLTGTDNTLLLGDVGDNILVQRGEGRALGGGGADILVAHNPRVVRKGESILVDPKLATDPSEDAAADKDLHVVLDGGEGDDWIFALGGVGAEVIGGKGRDFIYNTSKGGIIYGDLRGPDPETGAKVADTSSKADMFWYSPGVTIEDPQVHDHLALMGIPLVGGSVNPGFMGSWRGLSGLDVMSPLSVGFGVNVAIGLGAQAAGVF